MPTRPLSQTRICIVGLGLMGGSLAVALRGKCSGIVAVELDRGTREQAINGGIVEFASKDLKEGVARADLLILATPVQTIIDLTNQLRGFPAPKTNPLTVLDLGSTKNEITKVMASLPRHFTPIGGHPMCGKETAGLTNADAAIFAGATFALTPLRRTTRDAMNLVHELVNAVDSHALVLDPERHDELASMTSHMPYLVACSLLSAAADLSEDDELIWSLAASGFKDMTRLAASDATVMLDILRTNRMAVQESINRIRKAINMMETLMFDDQDELERALHKIRTQRVSRFPQ